MSDKKASNEMWGGRFASGPAAIMEAINASIGFDRKLYAEDIAGSQAHARMLAEKGIISREDQEKIAHGLNTILAEIEAGKFAFSTRLEDIHMNVEQRLAELIGAAAGPINSASLASTFMWMSSSFVENSNLPLSISVRILFSP